MLWASSLQKVEPQQAPYYDQVGQGWPDAECFFELLTVTWGHYTPTPRARAEEGNDRHESGFAAALSLSVFTSQQVSPWCQLSYGSVLEPCTRHIDHAAHGIRTPIRVETMAAAVDTGVPLALPAEAALVRKKLGRQLGHTGELAYLSLRELWQLAPLGLCCCDLLGKSIEKPRDVSDD